MKNIILFTLILSCSFSAHSQWQTCNTAGYGYIPKSFIESSGNLNLNGGCISADSGNTWTATATGMVALSITKNSAGMFAGTSDSICFSNTNGATWTGIYNSGNNNFVYGITMLNDTIFAATRASGILMSPDNGNTFSPVNSGIPNDSIYSILAKGNLLFAGVFGNGIYRSSNSGATWIQVNNGIPATAYVSSLITDGTRVYAAAGNAVYITDNDGASWTTVSFTSNPVAKLCLAGNTLMAGGFTWAGTDGVYRSFDQGITWSVFNNGLPACNFGIGVLYATDTYVFCGMESQCGGSLFRIPLNEVLTSSQSHEVFNNNFSIYPNPCSDFINIKWNDPSVENTELLISDVNGKIILEQTVDDSNSIIKLESLTSGIYFLHLNDGNRQMHQKLLIIH